MSLVWTPELSTGVLELDRQHRKLFDFINELRTALTDPVRSRDAKEIEKAVTYIREYTEIHFRTEEICMEKYQCPVAGANKEAHARFLAETRKFEAGLSSGFSAAEALEKFERFLESWWMRHICRIDVNLKGVAPAV